MPRLCLFRHLPSGGSSATGSTPSSTNSSPTNFSQLIADLVSIRNSLVEGYNALFESGGVIYKNFSACHYGEILNSTPIISLGDLGTLFGQGEINMLQKILPFNGVTTDFVVGSPQDDPSPLQQTIKKTSHAFQSKDEVIGKVSPSEFACRLISIFKDSPDYIWIQLHSYQKTRGHEFPEGLKHIIRNLQKAFSLFNAPNEKTEGLYSNFSPEGIMTRFTNNLMNILRPPENKEEITHAITFLGRISTLIEGINNLLQHISDPQNCAELLSPFRETLSSFQTDITAIAHNQSQQEQLKNIITTAAEVISIMDSAFSSTESVVSAPF